jgi:phosphatidylserine/phosphatidylglycerophosphate/cardiolipin synthase-like enzyme
MSAASKLGEFVTRDEASRLAASLELDGLVHRAVRSVAAARRQEVQRLLVAVADECGGNQAALVAVLRALAGVPQAARPQLVWTSPSLPGIEGHTTLAVSELINEAQLYVYAATYSATMDSPYVTALRQAQEKRGVKVTLILDFVHQQKAAAAMVAKLPGARVWTLPPPETAGYAAQHAKIVMIDGLATIVTSANFSTAAADNNLECGVLLRDAPVARAVKSHLDTLRREGYLADYDG